MLHKSHLKDIAALYDLFHYRLICRDCQNNQFYYRLYSIHMHKVALGHAIYTRIQQDQMCSLYAYFNQSCKRNEMEQTEMSWYFFPHFDLKEAVEIEIQTLVKHQFLPDSHLVPLKHAEHVQEKLFVSKFGIQKPPLRQGSQPHGSVAEKRNKGVFRNVRKAIRIYHWTNMHSQCTRTRVKTTCSVHCLFPRTTVTSLMASKNTRCKTHPLFMRQSRCSFSNAWENTQPQVGF